MAHDDHSLGKSLSSVFARTAKKEQAGGRGFLEVDLNLIIPPKDNPRQRFDDAALAELAASIEQHGIIQPLVVMKQEGGYEIIAGERRYRAAKRLGLATVPVVVHQQEDERQLAQLRLIENIQREDLDAIELAEAYRSLIQVHGLTQEQAAERVGKDRSSISNSIRLLTLPRPVQALVAEGRIGMGHARALAALDDPERCRRLAQRIADEGLSVRAAERLAREVAAEDEAAPATPSPRKRAKPPAIRELEGNLGRLFDAEIDIRERGGKGAMTIRFHSKGHFKAVIDQLEQAFTAAKRAPAEGAG